LSREKENVEAMLDLQTCNVKEEFWKHDDRNYKGDS
jgi:hypothetical protein